MLYVIFYAILGYFVVGTIVYIWGHPLRKRATLSTKTGQPAGKRGILYRQLGHSAQAVNFLVHSVAVKEQTSASIQSLYSASVRRAFDKKHIFITTGSPHSRAFYLRNFAWFYPDLLNSETIVDEADRNGRISILERSLRIALETMGARPYTTTIVPLTANNFAAVNYVRPPSDSLLGVLAGIEQLVDDPDVGAHYRSTLLAKHRENIEKQITYLAGQLKKVVVDGKEYRLLDANRDMSSATDTRRERMRFVVSANVWTTFVKAEKLGLMDGNVFARFGLDKIGYKKDILGLFGRGGYICNSLDPAMRGLKGTDNITLDFAHIYRGFWDLSQPDERALFKNTADLIFSDPTFHDISDKCYFVSNKDPDYHFMHKYATPSYHGRTVWSSFNVEFADRLLDLSVVTSDDTYRYRALRILMQLKNDTERNGGYPELMDADGRPYRTWIYRGALADSWFPRFAGVWYKAFGSTIR